jgi:hypothetical protein
VPIEVLKHYLMYDPLTGIFTRRIDCNGELAGSICNRIDKTEGYVILCVKNIRLKAHRAAWAYMTGTWPTALIDHKNRRRDDNRFVNLREANDQTSVFNLKELRLNNTSGLRGVFKYGNKWRAAIRYKNKLHHLGTYEDKFKAKEVYEEAKNRLHVI